MSERRPIDGWRDRSGKEHKRSNDPRKGASPWRAKSMVQTGAIPKVKVTNAPKKTKVKKVKYINLLQLETISLCPPVEALNKLLTVKEHLLNSVKSKQILPDFLTLLYEVLSNIVTSPDCLDVVPILIDLERADFLKATAVYILDLPLEEGAKKLKNARFWADHDRFFLSVATTLNALLEMAPITGTDVLPQLIKTIVYSLTNFERCHKMRFDATVHAAYEKLSAHLNEIIEQQRLQEEERIRRKQQPPDNFRDIDVYPLVWEVNSRARSFLRKNIIKGPYDSLDHYLDVQFRLIREDFVAPLRDGICEYLDADSKRKLSNIKIHNDVRCIGMWPNQGQMGYLLQVFNPKSIRNSETSRRFMYGSLVCLTEDYFQSILFGRIIDCDKKHLTAGRLSVCMADNNSIDPRKTYTLAECTVYFEPYFHVLNALKTIQMLPMTNYLVNVSNKTANDQYGFASCEAYGKGLGLNDSQQEAFAAALTKEFCVIQGPPGTGKTHLCLHVTRELIKQFQGSGPILIISYTNHALDQFLEGLLETTGKLIRVGGQSKNERLKQYNFKEVKYSKQNKYISNESYKDKYNKDNIADIDVGFDDIDYNDKLEILPKIMHLIRLNKTELEELEKNLICQGTLIGMICQFKHIVNFDFFNNFKIDEHYRNSWFAKATPDELLDWLLYLSPAEQESLKNIPLKEPTLEIESEITEEESYDADDPRRAHLSRDNHGMYLKELKFCQTDYYLCVSDMYKNTQKYKKNHHQTSKLCVQMETKYKYIMKQLDLLSHMKKESNLSEITVNYNDPHKMATTDRWLLYGAWLSRLTCEQMKELKATQNKYEEIYKNNARLNDRLNLQIFHDAAVIGMTTSSAARLHNTLQTLGCQIVIVEEAAEVLEAHIVTALSPSCSKLILVGDHKQLKPSTSDYNITREFNLGISLFERMVANGVRCYTLDVQHRMRPQIASLISPSIYPRLRNAAAVHSYPGIRGFSKSLFFITHQHREVMAGDSSKSNPFEAEYLIRLARHLILNGYEAKQITIIAAYSGQWFEMNRIKNSLLEILNDTRICILDNFQGEENDIILLSLVRNNEEGANGFLNLRNRICVALSRARHGLYIMGNMPQLVKGSALWQQVAETLNYNESLGEFLTAHCINHPRTATVLREVSDFDKVPLGGCQLPCKLVLKCGHVCKLLCHIGNHDKCAEPCKKVLCDLGHVCPNPCYVNCDKCVVPKQCKLPCGHTQKIPCHQLPEEYVCKEVVRLMLNCGHEACKPCHVNINNFKCVHPCKRRNAACGHKCIKQCSEKCEPCVFQMMKAIPECGHQILWECWKPLRRSDCNRRKCCKILSCGHECVKPCSEECLPCKMLVPHELDCGHTQLLKCHENKDNVKCNIPCPKTLSCGHNCTKKCSQMCDPCVVKVKKKIEECGHERIWDCGRKVMKKNCIHRECSTVMQCGHKCRKRCAENCDPCEVQVNRKLKCGHSILMKCHEDINSIRCRKSCREILACGHKCTKRCFESCEPCEIMVTKKIEECGHNIVFECGLEVQKWNCISEKCANVLPCGHECIKNCKENCQPCRVEEKHELSCGHSQLVECHQALKDVKCRNPCEKKLPCEHDCTKKCFEKCIPCEIQMNKTIPECGHEMMWECGSEVHQWNCNSQKCPKVLPCGHECIKACRENCQPCRVKEMRELSCGHSQLLECHQAIKDVQCTNPCEKKLACGHKCTKTCFESCEPCEILVLKKIEECGHNIIFECGLEVQKLNCTSKKKCAVVLPCGHECIKNCEENCQPCIVEEMRELSCGHSQLVECHQALKDVQCTYPCEKKLACGHDCTKDCIQSCEPCKVKVNKTIPECGHEMMWECGSEVQKRNCTSKCAKVLSCGHPCRRLCGQPCSGYVKHVSLLKLRGCAAKCETLLSCGHQSSGTCSSCTTRLYHAGCKECGMGRDQRPSGIQSIRSDRFAKYRPKPK